MSVLIVIRDALIAAALAWVGVQFEPAEHNNKPASGEHVQSSASR